MKIFFAVFLSWTVASAEAGRTETDAILEISEIMTEPVDSSTSTLSYLHPNMSGPHSKILNDGRFSSLYISLCTLFHLLFWRSNYGQAEPKPGL